MDCTEAMKANVNTSLETVVAGMRSFYRRLTQLKFQTCLQQLSAKIRSSWQRSPNVERLRVLREDALPLRDHNINFSVKVIATRKYEEPKEKKPADYDPFERKVCEKNYLASLSKTHALIYNKFPLVPSHVLVITKEMERQTSFINRNDFYAALKVLQAMDCFVFFNGGAAAGSSQRHKHLQAIPLDSFPNSKMPLNALVEATEENDAFVEGVKYTKINAFKFKHVLCKFEKGFMSNIGCGSIERQAKALEEIYMECQRQLGNSDLHLAYNFILTKNWFFVVLRKSEVAMGVVKINGAGFTGSFAVGSEEELEFVMKQDPIEILQAVAFPA